MPSTKSTQLLSNRSGRVPPNKEGKTPISGTFDGLGVPEHLAASESKNLLGFKARRQTTEYPLPPELLSKVLLLSLRQGPESGSQYI